VSTYHTRLEGRLIFAVQQLPPVDAVEEIVRLDLRRTVCSQSLLSVTVKKFSEKVTRSWWHNIGAWEVQWFCENLAVHLVGILVVEGW
jgi:hypothetical protein